MIRKFSTVVALAGVFALGGVYSAHASTRSGVAAVRGVAADSVTGCLQKGNKKDMYSVTDAGGTKHWVMSTAVPLSKHVGHTVTVVGTMGGAMGGDKMASANNKMASDSQMSGSSKMGNDTAMKMSGGHMGMGAMTVTSMSMVSATCK
jgi:hypothetical protein